MNDYKELHQEEPCICGHLKGDHMFQPYVYIKGKNGEDSYCRMCQSVPLGERPNVVHKFVLDNLAYIEQMAKKKNLI